MTTAKKHYGDWPNEAAFQAEQDQRDPVELRVSGYLPPEVAGTLYRTGPAFYVVGRDGEGTAQTSKPPFKWDHWFDGFTTVHRFQILAPADDGSHGADGDGNVNSSSSNISSSNNKNKSCRVVYNSRCQVDELVELARRQGRFDHITFGQRRDPCDSLFKKVKTAFVGAGDAGKTPGTANVGVTVNPNFPGVPVEFKHDIQPIQSLTCLIDANRMTHLNPETLEPLGVVNQRTLHPALTGPLSAAHAQRDPLTGDVINYNLAFGGRSPTYRVFRTRARTGDTQILATITDLPPAYLHSTFLTRDYFVLCVWPAHFRAGGAAVLWERSLLGAMAWRGGADDGEKTRWVVVDRTDRQRGVVGVFESEPFFSMHTINAWQEPAADGRSGKDETKAEAQAVEDILCDVITYPNMDVLELLRYENIVSSSVAEAADKKTTGGFRKNGQRPSSTDPRLERFRLRGVVSSASASASASVSASARDSNAERSSSGRMKTLPVAAAEKVLTHAHKGVGDLPTINPLFSTKKSRFVYSAVDRGLSSFYDGISKIDTETGHHTLWSHPRHSPGEAIFVPRRRDRNDEAGSEDDGYLLSVVLDGDKSTSYLLCLDARDMREVGRAECPVAVAFGFHGAHYQ